jgi:hypothetical protein
MPHRGRACFSLPLPGCAGPSMLVFFEREYEVTEGAE